MRSNAILISVVVLLAALVGGTVYLLGREAPVSVKPHAPAQLLNDRDRNTAAQGPAHAATPGPERHDEHEPEGAQSQSPTPADPHSICGEVQDARGKAISDARVSVLGAHLAQHTKSDGLGTFEFRGLPEGAYAVTASKAKYGGARAEAVAPGSPRLTLVLQDMSVVSGSVMDGMTGQPVPDFQVLALAEEHLPSLRANPPSWLPWVRVHHETGRFTLDGVASETPLVVAARSERHALGLVHVEAIGRGETVDGVVITLGPAARVEGRVVDQEGRPIAEASVYVGKEKGGNLRATTDDAGRFTITALVPEDRLLTVTHPRYLSGAAEIAPRLGKTSRVQVVLERGGRIEGHVRRGGQPVEGLPVSVLPAARTDRRPPSVDTGPDGRYAIETVPTGEMLVVVRSEKESSPTAYLARRPAIVETGAVTVVDFDLPMATCVLEGTVTANGGPAPAAHVVVKVSGTDYEMDRWQRVEPDGRYRFEGLPPGAAALRVEVEVRPGRRHWKTLNLALTEGEIVRRDVQFNLSCAIQGTVAGAREIEEITDVIVLWGEIRDLGAASRERLIEVGQSQAAPTAGVFQGAYTVDQLEPGLYTVVVSATRMPTDERDTLYLDIRWASEVVELRPGERAQVNLVLPEN